MPRTARIEGMTLCGRALCSLALAAREAAGADAVERLVVVLHLSEDQAEDVMEELHVRRCYGCVCGGGGGLSPIEP
jgi:hypothetical protein